MLEWLGAEGDRLAKSFEVVFGGTCRPFGNRALTVGGVSDGARGVQWNASYDPRDQRQWVSVNLEGVAYDGWPVARLIVRELRAPRLLEVARTAPSDQAIEVRWMRDYWQASARPRIREVNIKPTPLLIGELTEAAWQQVLEGARACLDASKDWKGRGKQRVTLEATGKVVEGGVSPHLTVTVHAASHTPWPELLSEAKQRLQPYYDWASERSK